MDQPVGGRSRVFVSYCHLDAEWLPRIQTHLKPLERAGLLDFWADTQIRTGARWREEIASAISAARVAVLLVSADFLGSDFITDVELPTMLAAAEKHGLRVLPVIVKPCRFRQTARLSGFQSLNPPERPVVSMSEAERELLWVRLSEEIEAAITVAPTRCTSERVSGDIPIRVFHVPYERNPFFTGRREVLHDIQQALQSTRKAALSGLGGIGKTQTAVEYAYEYADNYDVIYWMSADSELGLTAGFTDFARTLGLPEAWDSNQTRSVEAARLWLEQHSRWLLILDNADEPNVVRRFRPQTRAGHLLLTSRGRRSMLWGSLHPSNSSA